MRHLITTGLLLSALLATPFSSAAEVEVAFVNTPRILEQAPQAQAARERLEKEFAPRDKELAAMQKQVKAQEDKLSREGDLMSADARRKAEREIVVQQREAKRAQEAFTEDLNLRRNEEFARLQREVSEVIVDLAKEKGYDLIFENGVVYASDRVDVTEVVLKRLRQKMDQGKK